MTLEQKTAIVTGASRGIGAEIVGKLHEEGVNVVLFSRDEAKLYELTHHMDNAHTFVVPGDVTNARDQKRLVEATMSHFGSIDIVVPCAGVVQFKALAETTEEVLAHQFNTNFFSAVSLTQLVVPHMMTRGGSIIFVSSSISTRGFPHLSAYAATKGALNSFMHCIAVELAPHHINVNAVLPGPTQTQMWTKALPHPVFEQVGAQIVPRLLTGQFGHPKYVADTVAWLAQTPTVCGQEITIDCGYTIS